MSKTGINTTQVDLTTELEEAIVNAYIKGDTRKGICAEFKISSGTLYRILNLYGVPRRFKGAGRTQFTLDTYTDEVKRKVYEDYQNGDSLETLRYRYGINKNTIYTLVDLKTRELSEHKSRGVVRENLMDKIAD